ncbi:MAG: hypothetical protein WKG00_02690 [Polyangiaceae bacterium]
MHGSSRLRRLGAAPSVSIGAIVSLLAVAACSSAPKPEPNIEAAPTAEPEASPEPAATGEAQGEDAPPPKKSSAAPVPDDYEMTNTDCAELGRALKMVIGNDERSKLSPKLKQNQRDAAESSIDRAAGTRQDQWVEGCQKSLVGKVVDRASLKCAVSAKTVKDFDACLNGPPPDAAPKP